MDELNIVECSCQGNNPDCYNCGGKGFLTKGDLIPDYKNFSYPSKIRGKVPHNLKDKLEVPKNLRDKKLELPNVIKWLKVLKDNRRKELGNKDTRLSKNSKSFSEPVSKKITKKQSNKGHNDKNKTFTKFTSSGNSVKNKTTIWSPDQLSLLNQLKEKIPHHYENHRKNNTKKPTQPNSYKMRGKNLSGTVHKNKPIYDDKIDHKLDGSKDYWQYRDHGKFGSHSDFDDMGDESNP
jgi:hypothetical protein